MSDITIYTPVYRIVEKLAESDSNYFEMKLRNKEKKVVGALLVIIGDNTEEFLETFDSLTENDQVIKDKD